MLNSVEMGPPLGAQMGSEMKVLAPEPRPKTGAQKEPKTDPDTGPPERYPTHFFNMKLQDVSGNVTGCLTELCVSCGDSQ